LQPFSPSTTPSKLLAQPPEQRQCCAVLRLSLYTILALPILYGVWHIKAIRRWHAVIVVATILTLSHAIETATAGAAEAEAQTVLRRTVP